MVFNLGYNTALEAGEAPAFGSVTYIILHAALAGSALGVLALLGGPLLSQLLRALSNGRISVEAMFFLSAVGALVGSAISSFTGDGAIYYEVVAVVVCVYAIGKQIGVYQRGRVGQAIAGMRRSFERVVAENADGNGWSELAVSALQPGQRVRVAPGEAIAVDAVIVSGSGYLRESALTGEPGPVRRQSGDPVQAGTWSIDADLILQPQLGSARAIDRLLHLLETAPARPAQSQIEADRIMRLFVPVVLSVSLITFGSWWLLLDATVWKALFNAMAVLLVACPCALGLATPAAIWSGLFQLSQRGIVARSGPLVDALANCTDVVFDKTGTLTELELQADADALRASPDLSLDELSALVASLAAHSPHPVNIRLVSLSAVRREVTEFSSVPGQGIAGVVAGRRLLLGEVSLLLDNGCEPPQALLPPDAGVRKHVHLAVDGRYCGCILLHERLRKGASDALQSLTQLGLTCHILSGDPAPAFSEIAGFSVHFNLSPLDKAERVRSLREAHRSVLFIGDGVNDVAAMQTASASLAIDNGFAVATEFADGLLANGLLLSLPASIRLCRRLRRRLRANLRFALLYNIAGISLAAAGLLHPVIAALIMVGSSLVVSLNALRNLPD